MTLYAFILNGVPAFRETLEEAQSAIEDSYLDRGYDHLQWGTEGDKRFGAYLWGFGFGEPGNPAPYEPKLIWEWKGVGRSADVSESADRLNPMEVGGAELTLTIRTRAKKVQFLRCYSEAEWDEDRLRPHLVTTFATRAGIDLADYVSKEGK